MSNCPKCGYKLHIYNISQYCPKCKINLMYADFEKKFFQDAKKTEMSLANARVKLQRIKVGLIGGKLQYIRLISTLLPLLSMLVPIGSVSVSLPIYSKTVTISILGLYSAFTDGTFNLIGLLHNGSILGETAKTLSMSFYAFILAAILEVLIVIFTVIAFVSFKKISAVICAFSAAGVVFAVTSTVLFWGAKSYGTLISVSNGAGILFICAAFIAVFVPNLIIAKKGLSIEYKEGDPERMAVRRQYRKKELTLDEIPFPIYETAAERISREEAIAKTEADTAEALGVDENV